MNSYTSAPADNITSPETWIQASFSETQGRTQLGGFVTATGSTSITSSDRATARTTFNRESSGGLSSVTLASFGSTLSNSTVNNFNPSTNTLFIPSSTTGSGTNTGTVPGSTITITRNSTTIQNSVLQTQAGTSLTSADTSSASSAQGTSGRTQNGTAATNNPTTGNTFISGLRTFNGASTKNGSSVATVGYSKRTTILTNTNGFAFNAFTTFTTSSYTGSETSDSFTTWETGFSNVTFSTSMGVSINTDMPTGDAVTYFEDIPTIETVSSGTTTIAVTTDVLTSHAISPFADTICLMRSPEFSVGQALWQFKGGVVGVNTSATGEFADFYSLKTGATETVADYKQRISTSVAVTVISVSMNTMTATTVSQTSTNSNNTVTTVVTIIGTSKNAVSWTSNNPLNTSTYTVTYSLGEVGTRTSSFSYLTGSSTSTSTFTIFTHSLWSSSYDSNLQFSVVATTDLWVGASSTTHTRLSLHSPFTTTSTVRARSTTTDLLLYEDWETYTVGTETSFLFLGYRSTATNRVYQVVTSTTRASYEAKYCPEVSSYNTSSTVTFAGGGNTTSFGIGQTLNQTYFSDEKAMPVIISRPPAFNQAPGMNRVIHSGPAYGIAGFGGPFDVSSMTVYRTVDFVLVDGDTFETAQDLKTSNLPTALAYPGVTFFPVNPNIKISADLAAGARYSTNLSGSGPATILVTWTSTTLSEGSETTVSRPATYLARATSSIGGVYFRSAQMAVDAADDRQSGFSPGVISMTGAGDNAITNPVTVFVDRGIARWTVRDSINESGSSSSAMRTNNSLSFTIHGSQAIALEAQPVFTASWDKNAGVNHIIGTLLHFRPGSA